MSIKKQEAFNFYSHLSGVIAAVIGTVFLALVACYSSSALITSLIYGASVIFLFLASSLYHAFKKEENELSFWRKMDRFAIFCMIAGTYTPVCYMFLDGPWRWSMIAIQWALVGFGLISQLYFPRAHRILYAGIYFIMGGLAFIPIRKMLHCMTMAQEVLLFAGCLFFGLGALIYATKKPKLVPGVFSYHELFHIMVLIGGGLLYAMIYIGYFYKIA